MPAKQLPKVVDTGSGNMTPEELRREDLRRKLLSGAAGASMDRPANASLTTEVEFMQQHDDVLQEEEPEQGASGFRMFRPAASRQPQFRVMLRSADFTLRFTTSLFSVSDHVIGVKLDKNVFTFEPRMTAEYEIACPPDSAEVHSVFYAGGYIDLQDGNGSALLCFMRVSG